jgi:hypothetical protein
MDGSVLDERGGRKDERFLKSVDWSNRIVVEKSYFLILKLLNDGNGPHGGKSRLQIMVRVRLWW